MVGVYWWVCYLLVRLVLGLPEEADILDESGLDVLIVHKLAEDVELLTQKLVGEVHLEGERVSGKGGRREEREKRKRRESREGKIGEEGEKKEKGDGDRRGEGRE